MAGDLDPRRHLQIEGSYNIRDLGGYETRNGRRTRWGRLLRSGSLHRLQDAAQQALLEYGLRTVIDLRRSVATGSRGMCAISGSANPRSRAFERRWWSSALSYLDFVASLKGTTGLAQVIPGVQRSPRRPPCSSPPWLVPW